RRAAGLAGWGAAGAAGATAGPGPGSGRLGGRLRRRLRVRGQRLPAQPRVGHRGRAASRRLGPGRPAARHRSGPTRVRRGLGRRRDRPAAPGMAGPVTRAITLVTYAAAAVGLLALIAVSWLR